MRDFNLSLLAIGASFVLAGCDSATDSTIDAVAPEAVVEAGTSTSLEQILLAQPADVMARYDARHPKETIEFFGIEPGMTVLEALPGGGWYTKILLPYLGAEGKVIGADYAADMFPLFGFFSAERLAAKETWVTTWTAEAKSWGNEDSADVSAFQFGSMPDSMANSADAVVFIRALHNVARFESEGGYLTKALSDAYKVLKPGGILGVVQHQAPESASDESASGANGYLKQSFVVAKIQEAGFEFVESSDINLNPKDQPTEKDIVWRLSPSLATSNDNPELREKMSAIGESSRMTLKFKKPLN